MAHLSRRAVAASVRVAAVLVVSAAAVPALRRGLQVLCGAAHAEPGGTAQVAPEGPHTNPGDRDSETDPPVADSVEVEGGSARGRDGGTDKAHDHIGVSEPGHVESTAAGDGTALNHPGDESGPMRMWAFARRGFTVTVAVLLVLAIATGVYGLLRLPNSMIPKPASSTISLAFSPGHYARWAITVQVFLSPFGKGVDLDIDVVGNDLTHAGLTVSALVPIGVQVPADFNYAQSWKVSSFGDTSEVDFIPGVMRDREFKANLAWPDLTSGPMQVIGANLVATFPDVVLANVPGNASPVVPVPTPQMTVTQYLDPGEDFHYLSGPPPDNYGDLTKSITVDSPPGWSWKPDTGREVLGITDVEAQSATKDDEAHTAEFDSGVALGVAAAALIAGIQEFVNSGRRREQETAG